MLEILVADSPDDAMKDLIAELEKHEGVNVTITDTAGFVLDKISRETPHLVIAAETLRDSSGLDLAAKIAATNPMINCAVASALAPPAYHEASEGLGILMQLPVKPTKEDATALLNHLKQISNLLEQD